MITKGQRDPHPGMGTEMINSQQPNDHRRDHRFELMDYAVATRPNHEGSFRSVVVDISLGGLQVRSRTEFVPGEICSLSIGRGNQPPLQIHGEVRYSQAIEDSDLFATGFRLLPESMGERIEWVDYVHNVFQVQGESLLKPT